MSEQTASPVTIQSTIKTMQIAQIAAPATLRIRQVPLVPLRAGQVRIRLQGCGICGSDLPLWQGRDWFDYPCVPGRPGHEGWGIIDRIGPGVQGFRVGERAAFIGMHSYAEYETVSADTLVKIPPTLDAIPFPGEPFACAMNIFERCGIRRGQTVAVVGIGFLGAMLTQLAAAAGAEVIAVSRRPFALSVAERCGAAVTLSINDPGRVIETVMERTDQNGCSVVIEAVGVQRPLELAAQLTAVRGRLVVAGYHQDGLRHVNMQLWNWRGLDVINAHERDPAVYLTGMRRAIDAIEAGRFRPYDLLTHAYSLEQLPEAFDHMTVRPDGFLKGYIRFEEDS